MTGEDITTPRRFGRTGLSVLPLAVGTGSWGPYGAGDEGRRVRVDELADAFFGGALASTVLDTANIYGGSQAESVVGDAIARAGGVADGLLVQTKLDRDPHSGRFDAARMIDSLAESLDRLGLSRVPVLYLHDPELIGFEASMAPGGPVEALLEMKREGVTASVGISGGPVDLLERFVATDVFDALITHNRWTLLDRSADRLLDEAHRRDLGVVNAAPFGAGILTGDERFRGMYGYKRLHPATEEALTRVTEICAGHAVPLAAAALQFSLRDPRIALTSVGVTSIGRFEAAVEFASVPMDDSIWDELESVAPPVEVALDRI